LQAVIPNSVEGFHYGKHISGQYNGLMNYKYKPRCFSIYKNK